jgi:hypothetical protein
MSDWHLEMPRILAALDRMRERTRRGGQFPRRMISYRSGPGGTEIKLMTRRHWLRLQIRLIPVRANSWLCRFTRWRRLMCEWRRPVDCTCTFADFERFGQSSHPTESCPLRTDCGGQTFSPPCGGCDRCLDDQQAYYEAKDRGVL